MLKILFTPHRNSLQPKVASFYSPSKGYYFLLSYTVLTCIFLFILSNFIFVVQVDTTVTLEANISKH